MRPERQERGPGHFSAKGPSGCQEERGAEGPSSCQGTIVATGSPSELTGPRPCPHPRRPQEKPGPLALPLCCVTVGKALPSLGSCPIWAPCSPPPSHGGPRHAQAQEGARIEEAASPPRLQPRLGEHLHPSRCTLHSPQVGSVCNRHISLLHIMHVFPIGFTNNLKFYCFLSLMNSPKRVTSSPLMNVERQPGCAPVFRG